MALAVTHIILTIAFLDIFRHYVFGLKKFPRYLLVIGGIAGLAPDLDVPLGWILTLLTGSSINIHGFFTHSIFFALLFVFIGAIFHYKKNMKWAKIFYVIAVGWTFHIFLDCFYGMDSSKLFLWYKTILAFEAHKFAPLSVMPIIFQSKGLPKSCSLKPNLWI